MLNSLLTLFPRWLDRKRPELHLDWTGAWSASERRIKFGVKLTNDGTKIAREVVVRGFLDGQQVYQANAVDVPDEAVPVEVAVVLQRPDQVDLSAALANRPVFYGKRFSAIATAAGRVLYLDWLELPEPAEDAPLTRAKQAEMGRDRISSDKPATRRGAEEGLEA
jgi:hypothetical protein